MSSPSKLKVNISEAKGKDGNSYVVIKLAGEIGADEIPGLNDAVRPYSNNNIRIILDLDNLTSISSLGLAFIIRLYSFVPKLKIILSPESKLIYEILNHVGITKIVKIYVTEEEALNNLE